MNQEHHFKYSVGDRVVEKGNRQRTGLIAEQMKLSTYQRSDNGEWEHTYAVKWDDNPNKIDRAGWFEWALEVRGTTGSRFNTCLHVGEDGKLDCDEKAHLEPQLGINPGYCIKHFREYTGLYTDDYELNTLILEWREFFDKR